MVFNIYNFKLFAMKKNGELQSSSWISLLEFCSYSACGGSSIDNGIRCLKSEINLRKILNASRVTSVPNFRSRIMTTCGKIEVRNAVVLKTGDKSPLASRIMIGGARRPCAVIYCWQLLKIALEILSE